MAILPVVYKVIQFFSSGNFYRIKISKSDTNLNITEKLLESIGKLPNTGKYLSVKSEDMCSKIIEESLFHIYSGYKVREYNFNTYSTVLSCTGLGYLAYFSTKIAHPNRSLHDSCKKSATTSGVTMIISILLAALLTIYIAGLFSKTESLQSIYLNAKEMIQFYFFLVIFVISFVLYVVSLNSFSNSVMLLSKIKRDTMLRSL